MSDDAWLLSEARRSLRHGSYTVEWFRDGDYSWRAICEAAVIASKRRAQCFVTSLCLVALEGRYFYDFLHYRQLTYLCDSILKQEQIMAEFTAAKKNLPNLLREMR
jgi:hypothetical protein